jgi:hypothetical protein
MNTHKITIEQTRLVEVSVKADTLEEAESLAMDSIPHVFQPEINSNMQYVYGTAQILPSQSEFDVDKTFTSVDGAISYIKSQRDPFDCLFRYIKHQSYWGELKLASEILAAATDIIEAQEGLGY